MIEKGDLAIAVSRRFRRPELDELYASRIEPLLVQYGIVLQCDFASDSVGDMNFWMNRMNIILDVADVHVFVDIDRSANTFYELTSSNLSCLFGPGVSLRWNFGIRPPLRETPNQILIYQDAEGTARISLAAGSSQKKPLHARTDVPLEDGLARALEAMWNAVKDFRSRHEAAKAPDDETLSPSGYWWMKTRIATLMARGLRPNEVLNLLMHDAYVNSDSAGRRALLAFREAAGAHRRDIAAYNRDLRTFTEISARVYSEKPRFRELFAAAGRLMELQMVAGGLREDPSYDRVVANVRSLRSARVLAIPMSIYVALMAVRLKTGRFALGSADRGERVRAQIQKRWYLRAPILLLSAYGFFVSLQYLDALLRPPLLVRVLFAIALGGAILYTVVMRITGAPLTTDSEAVNRRLAWLIQEHSLLRWMLYAFGGTVAISFWWWLGASVIPSFLGPHVYGGTRTVRIGIIVLLVLMVVRGAALLTRRRHEESGRTTG